MQEMLADKRRRSAVFSLNFHAVMHPRNYEPGRRVRTANEAQDKTFIAPLYRRHIRQKLYMHVCSILSSSSSGSVLTTIAQTPRLDNRLAAAKHCVRIANDGELVIAPCRLFKHLYVIFVTAIAAPLMLSKFKGFDLV
jgi:hypothetical protein